MPWGCPGRGCPGRGCPGSQLGARAAAHRFGCPPACSGRPSGPERSAGAAWPKAAESTASAHPPRRDLLQTEHAALKHLNASLHELLKEKQRDAARASAECQRAAGTGVGPAESRDKDREYPQP